jgi:hypothetical protein
MARGLLSILAATALVACSRAPDAPQPTAPPPLLVAAQSASARPAAASPAPPSPHPPSPEPVSPAPTAATTAPAQPGLSAQTTPVLKLLVELHHLLLQDALTIKIVTDRVGPIVEDPGMPMPVTLKPRAAELQQAKLARYPEGGAVYILELQFTPEARPTFQELRSVFGKDRRIGNLHGERGTIFYPTAKGKGWKVAVIAEMSPCFDPHSAANPPPGPCEKVSAQSRAEKLTFRRDPTD